MNTYGKLTFVRPAGHTKRYRKLWEVKCECGGSKIMIADNVRYGLSRSCGCMNKDLFTPTHNESSPRTKEYRAWKAMKDRCYQASHPKFDYYGGRGISVCDTWRNSYETFLADVGRAPTSDHTIDRIEPDGNYTPQNVRWATRKEQRQNQRPKQQ